MRLEFAKEYKALTANTNKSASCALAKIELKYPIEINGGIRERSREGTSCLQTQDRRIPRPKIVKLIRELRHRMDGSDC